MSMAPLPSVSHSRNKSISFTECSDRIVLSWSEMLTPEVASSCTIGGSAETRLPWKFLLMFLFVTAAPRLRSDRLFLPRFRLVCAASEPLPLRSMVLSSLYSSVPDLSASSSSKTTPACSSETPKPKVRTARIHSFLSIEPELSSSHLRNRSHTRSEERASASRSEKARYSGMSTLPLPSTSSASNFFLSSSSVKSPISRSRIKLQNSPKSSLPSLSSSAASRSVRFSLMPTSKSSVPVPATSFSATSSWPARLSCCAAASPSALSAMLHPGWLRR